jgi:hypothetical protein
VAELGRKGAPRERFHSPIVWKLERDDDAYVL